MRNRGIEAAALERLSASLPGCSCVPKWSAADKRNSPLKSYIAAGATVLVVGLTIASIGSAQTKSGKVVTDAQYTSAYDAFMKVNRFREKFNKDESAGEYWGQLATRLGNQAGRNLIKRPTKGFSEDAFFGWMYFTRAYGDDTRIGNCAACHRPDSFSDGEEHLVAPGMKKIVTPSLRDLQKKEAYFHDGSAKTLEEAIKIHLENGRIAQQKKLELIDIDLGLIALSDEEIKKVAEFLRSLKSLDRDAFREAIIDVEVQLLDIEELF